MPILVKNLSEFKQMEGQELPPSEWLTVTQEMINSFADATLDFQWIHTDAERATKESPFKAPIAHGFLSLSLIPKLMADSIRIQSVKMGINYGVNKVRFPHHVPAASRVRLKNKITKVESYAENGAKITWHGVIEIEGVEKPACVAEFVSLSFE